MTGITQKGVGIISSRGARRWLAGWIVAMVGIFGMARERTVWTSVLIVDLISIALTIHAAHSVRDAIAPSALPLVAAIIVALIAAGGVFAVSRVVMWRLTRAYASTTPARLPAFDRARLCNISPALVILAFSATPRGLAFPTYEVVIAALVVVGGLIWFALKGPLERLNARDAARNQERAT